MNQLGSSRSSLELQTTSRQRVFEMLLLLLLMLLPRAQHHTLLFGQTGDRDRQAGRRAGRRAGRQAGRKEGRQAGRLSNHEGVFVEGSIWFEVSMIFRSIKGVPEIDSGRQRKSRYALQPAWYVPILRRESHAGKPRAALTKIVLSSSSVLETVH